MLTAGLVLAAGTVAGPGPVLDDLDRGEPAGPRRMLSVLSLPTASASAAASDSSPSVNVERSAATQTDRATNSAVPSGASRRIALKPVAETVDPAASVRAAQELGLAPIRKAIAAMQACLARYMAITDYTCVFSKRERIDGQLSQLHVMSMKFRTKPNSVYLRFMQPGAGREAIYIDGRNNGKVLAHDIGINKILAGTLWLDPAGSMAMEDNRHPITEAGIGPLIQTLLKRWNHELTPGESIVVISEEQGRLSRPGTTIETIHPDRAAHFMFHKVRVTIDREFGLPVRFEAYNWPDANGVPELVEEYSYAQIKLNVGLTDKDFDVQNAEYAFGRL
jgi:hypothetical protein